MTTTKSSIYCLLITLLLVASNPCSSFSPQKSSPPNTCRTTGTVSSTLGSHAIGPKDSIAIKGGDIVLMNPKQLVTTGTTSQVDDSNMVLGKSVAGLMLLALVLSLSAASCTNIVQNIHHMDDGSAATLIVDAVFGAIAVVVSVVTSDDQ